MGDLMPLIPRVYNQHHTYEGPCLGPILGQLNPDAHQRVLLQCVKGKEELESRSGAKNQWVRWR